MEKLKKYQTQIFNGITIFLIVTFVIFPGLTESNTLLNIMAGIGLLLLLVWGGLALYHYVTSDEGGIVDKEELKEADKMWKEHVMKQMDEMQKMHKENESLKKKSNPKQFDGVESDKYFVKTRKKTTKTK